MWNLRGDQLVRCNICCPSNKTSTTLRQLGRKQKELVYYPNDPSWRSSRLASQFCEKRTFSQLACASTLWQIACASISFCHHLYVTQCLVRVTESSAGKCSHPSVIHISQLVFRKPCVSVGQSLKSRIKHIYVYHWELVIIATSVMYIRDINCNVDCRDGCASQAWLHPIQQQSCGLSQENDQRGSEVQTNGK